MYTVAKTWRRVWGAEHFFADQDFSMTFFPEKNFRFHGQKNSFMTPFLYSLRTFARIRQHYFSKYWGTDAWAVPPPQIFWGTVPPVPPMSPPMHVQ